jgi:hypothetical protein
MACEIFDKEIVMSRTLKIVNLGLVSSETREPLGCGAPDFVDPGYPAC